MSWDSTYPTIDDEIQPQALWRDYVQVPMFNQWMYDLANQLNIIICCAQPWGIQPLF